MTWRCALAASLSFVMAGCSFVTVSGTPPPAAIASLPPGVPVPCTASNWAAGVDMVLLATSLLAAGASSEDVDDISTPEREDEVGDSSAIGLVVFSVVPAISMIYGFKKTGHCRATRRARGEIVGGDSDWVWPPLIIVTIGIAATARSRNQPTDDDHCTPGARTTALCRDGTASCSLNRSGTCSHHGGVQYWY